MRENVKRKKGKEKIKKEMEEGNYQSPREKVKKMEKERKKEIKGVKRKENVGERKRGNKIDIF